ncbi:DNA-binding transcriptional LysR family regulator [Oxalobacteraceae bacterium GrIS 1.11]
MTDISIQELLYFDAVVSSGSFQAAADKLHRTHPSVYTAVKNLEQRLGLVLLDRSGYRVALTDVGRSFHEKAGKVLDEVAGLRRHAEFLGMGEESQLRIMVGDLCPLPIMLGMLRRFFDDCPATRLHLQFEAIGGPVERLLDGDADLILHHIDKADPRLEYLDLCAVQLVPVVAPGFLPFPIDEDITPKQMRDSVQCIIRDTARHLPSKNYHVIEGAHSWTVSDQLMKKEIIVQAMGWGHMPTFLIEQELQSGRLLSLCGKHFKASELQLVAARRRASSHGPVATRLWSHLAM